MGHRDLDFLLTHRESLPSDITQPNILTTLRLYRHRRIAHKRRLSKVNVLRNCCWLWQEAEAQHLLDSFGQMMRLQCWNSRNGIQGPLEGQCVQGRPVCLVSIRTSLSRWIFELPPHQRQLPHHSHLQTLCLLILRSSGFLECVC